jgi:Ca2+-binding RTX toxin-like protein
MAAAARRPEMAHIIDNDDGNTLTGTKNADRLEGRGGNDFLIGKSGNDILDGGADNDFVVYTNSANGVTVDLLAGTAKGEGNDTLISIENVDGSMKVDTIKLANGAEFANGNGGNDTIWGRGGADTLFGGDGNDKLYGEAGDDIELSGLEGDDFLAPGVGLNTMVRGGDGNDTVSYFDTNVGMTVYLWDDEAFDSGFNGIVTNVLDSIENAEGSTKADHIEGTDEANVLKGLGGGDTVKGLAGNDEIRGGDGNDFLYGDDGNDALYGDKGNDNLYGGAGNNQMYGGVGNDVLWGSGDPAQVELFVGDAGKDAMHGFGGKDTFRFESISDSAVGANRDHVVDLFRSEGDKIDLSAIDAKTGQSGNQAFNFIGDGAFFASGQIRFVDQGTGAKLLQVNNDGDLQADMEIMLGMAPQLGAQDFIL